MKEISTKTIVSYNGLPETLEDCTLIGSMVAEGQRIWHQDLWLHDTADMFAVWEWTEAQELPGAAVGKIHGWYTFKEVNEKFPHFGLRRDDEQL